LSHRRALAIITLQLRPHRRRVKPPEIALTSFIDVIFTLLIFLAVSSSFSTVQDGIKLDLPEAVTADHPFEGAVVSLNENGQLFFEGRELPDLATLQTEIASKISTSPQLEVVVQAHRMTTYDAVMSVLDTIRLGGCDAIVLEAKRLDIPKN